MERPESRFLRLVLALPFAGLVGWGSWYLPYPEGASAVRGALGTAVTALTAFLWLSRAIPLAPASLVPLALFPLLGVGSTATVATAYAHPILWLFFGGFVLARAIERWGLHRRLALHIIAAIGLRPRRLVLGFMVAGGFLSMWISNTATSLMLLPIGLALADRVRELGALSEEGARRLTVALLLGILIWVSLVFVVARLPRGDARSGDSVRAELKALPRLSPAELRVLIVFAVTVLLWVTRKDVPLGGGDVIRGWGHLLGFTGSSRNFVEDGSVAVLMAILTFLIPSGGRGSPPLMDWKTAKEVPFDILFLLGGGIAIAAALKDTGVCTALAIVLQPWVTDVPPIVAVLLTVTLLVFLTEVTSNTATTALMLPILSATGVAGGIDPRLLMIPATLAASCAFMLPIATPPNAVVFSSGRLEMAEMARAGLLLNVISIVVLTLAAWLVLVPLLGIDPKSVPSWWLR